MPVLEAGVHIGPSTYRSLRTLRPPGAAGAPIGASGAGVRGRLGPRFGASPAVVAASTSQRFEAGSRNCARAALLETATSASPALNGWICAAVDGTFKSWSEPISSYDMMWTSTGQ